MAISVGETFETLLKSLTDVNDGFYRMVYGLFWHLQRGDITAEQNLAEVMLQLDHPEVESLMQNNVLNIKPAQLFVVTDSTGYAFYLGYDVLTVRQLHQQHFTNFKQVTRATRLMYKTFTLAAMHKDISPFEYRYEVPSMPCYLGHASAGSYVLHNLQRGGGRSATA